MDAIEMLAAQHRRATGLLQEVASATGEPRRKLVLDLADALTLHTSIEERYFYPAVYDAQTQEFLIHAAGQHVTLKRALQDLLRTDTGSDTFGVELQRLADEVAHHVVDEESDLFPQAAAMLSRHQRESLAQLMTGAMDDLEDPELREGVPPA